jgi:pimeloyl-ACP methyl ester carboxylesterase
VRRQAETSDLAYVVMSNGEFRKNYGLLIGACLYLFSLKAACGRSFPWTVDSEGAARAYLRTLHAGASERSISTRLALALVERDGRRTWRLDPAIFPLKPDPPERSWGALAAIECPTLVVRAGNSDLVTVECADRMVQTLKLGEGASVSNAGHMVLEDNPAGFAKVALPFLKKHLSPNGR